MLVDAVGRAQRQEYLLRTDGRILRVRHFREQDHEFIAALPADGVRAAHASEQPLRHGLQQAVADGVAQRVVDVLEAIHVQEQHRQFLPVTVRQGHRLGQPVVEQ